MKYRIVIFTKDVDFTFLDRDKTCEVLFQQDNWGRVEIDPLPEVEAAS